jgi:hypothetical protein
LKVVTGLTCDLKTEDEDPWLVGQGFVEDPNVLSRLMELARIE